MHACEERDLRPDRSALLNAVTRLLADRNTENPLAEGCAVTVLRSCDRISRRTASSLRQLLERHGIRTRELFPVPRFGTWAQRCDADLVIAADRSVAAQALRCAARWQVPALAAHVVPLVPGWRTTRQDLHPAAVLTTPDGTSDVLTRSVHISGQLMSFRSRRPTPPSTGIQSDLALDLVTEP